MVTVIVIVIVIIMVCLELTDRDQLVSFIFIQLDSFKSIGILLFNEFRAVVTTLEDVVTHDVPTERHVMP